MMGEHFHLTRQLLEIVLQYLDGETLLVCTEVSQEFAETIKYLSEASGIWRKCFSKERGHKYPFDVVSKLYPHIERWDRPKEWGRIYEATLFGSRISKAVDRRVTEIQLGKHYSDIVDCETHGDFILVLLKYNKNFSKYQRIVVIDSDNRVVDKTCHFVADTMYIATLDAPAKMNDTAIVLYCDVCDFCAVPLSTNGKARGFPKFTRNAEYLMAEHSNGETFYMNSPKGKKLFTFGNSFHCGKFATPEELKEKDLKYMKVTHSFETLTITSETLRREFCTFKHIRSCVTASLLYGSLLLLGTDTGMLYAYKLDNDLDLMKLDLERYASKIDVCTKPILYLSVMEDLKEFHIVCCSEKSVFIVHLKRKVYNNFVVL